MSPTVRQIDGPHRARAIAIAEAFGLDPALVLDDAIVYRYRDHATIEYTLFGDHEDEPRRRLSLPHDKIPE